MLMVDGFAQGGRGRSGVRAARGVLLTLALAAVALAAFAAGCGEDGATIIIKDLSFEPNRVTIKAGETVTWKNEDRRSHQIMSGAPPVMTDDFVSPNLSSGESWSHTFDEPGDYPFHSMTGGLLGWVEVEG